MTLGSERGALVMPWSVVADRAGSADSVHLRLDTPAAGWPHRYRLDLLATRA